MTVTKIDPVDLSLLQREMNKSLMVAWINADLLNRAGHDVRKSIVIYDADQLFLTACRVETWEDPSTPSLAYDLGGRFWSKGAV